jgi:septal ring factor EnvC (AmiA/AmiB activator)
MNAGARARTLVAAATLGAIAIFGAGCGSNPPCETNLAAVDAARKSAADAETRLAQLKQQKQQLEQQIVQEKSRQDELAKQKAELEAKIAELSK